MKLNNLDSGVENLILQNALGSDWRQPRFIISSSARGNSKKNLAMELDSVKNHLILLKPPRRCTTTQRAWRSIGK
jgi:hypothetical protein